MQGYIATAQLEWDDLSAARFAAVAMQFSQTVDNVPAWKSFKKSAPTGELSSDDLNSAEEISASLAKALEDELSEVFVDREILQQLEEIAREIPEVISPESGDRIVTPDAESRAFDLLESINNILKRIFGAALWMRGKLTEFGVSTWAPFANSAKAENRRQAEELGKWSVKWAYRIVKGGAIAGLAWLATKFPWLGPVIKFFQSVVL